MVGLSRIPYSWPSLLVCCVGAHHTQFQAPVVLDFHQLLGLSPPDGLRSVGYTYRVGGDHYDSGGWSICVSTQNPSTATNGYSPSGASRRVRECRTVFIVGACGCTCRD